VTSTISREFPADQEELDISEEKRISCNFNVKLMCEGMAPIRSGLAENLM
jgi:hypothetical protein